MPHPLHAFFRNFTAKNRYSIAHGQVGRFEREGVAQGLFHHGAGEGHGGGLAFEEQEGPAPRSYTTRSVRWYVAG